MIDTAYSRRYTPAPGDPYVETDPAEHYDGNLLDVAANLANAPTDWKRQAEEALRLAIESGNEFTTDELRDLGAPDLEVAKEQQAVWGSLVAAAKAQKRIERVGDRVSSRRSANGRRVAVWRKAAA